MMTKKTFYVGPHGIVDPPQVRDATWLRVQGMMWEVSKLESGVVTAEKLQSSVATSPLITLTPVCGDPVLPGSPTVDYSVLSAAGATELDLYWAGGSIIVDTYLKQ
jgi:hypothetical protein